MIKMKTAIVPAMSILLLINTNEAQAQPNSTSRNFFIESDLSKCDKLKAQEELKKVSKFAGWNWNGNFLVVQWYSRSITVSKQVRLEWIRPFSVADACLAGKFRKIQFYFEGKLVGLVSPETGVWIYE